MRLLDRIPTPAWNRACAAVEFATIVAFFLALHALGGWLGTIL